MSESTSASRVTVDGKGFRLGTGKFHACGVTYGPFASTPQTGTFPSRSQALVDFDLLRQLRVNVLRVYDVPPPWFLDLALAHDLRLLIDIPWTQHLCFLDRPDQERAACEAVRQAARACAGHSAVFAYSVANEIPPEIVRWHSAPRIIRFLDRLTRIVRENDPGSLCTFASYPPTEFLSSNAVDFVCYDLALPDRRAFEEQLARLHVTAGTRPLLVGACGSDSIVEGDTGQAGILAWQIESTFRAGCAGFIALSFTDEGTPLDSRAQERRYGITTRERAPKEAFRTMRELYREAPYFRLSRLPRVSVIVACRNGERTLRSCLDSLCHLRYPDYEVVFVDDGSTDGTAQIAQAYPGFHYLRQSFQGLSVARNAGVAAAQGEIVAFIDSDCRADEDWLYFLVHELLSAEVAAAGGPNLAPADESRLAAAVAVSPGGPRPVMITARDAEHLPGCNLAVWRWALEAIGGFDPVFQKAGDDADLCWRLLERGWKIRFSPAAMVWHYHRPTIRAYLRQQFGYGEAEALLAKKHPRHFHAFGGDRWGACLCGAPTPAFPFNPAMIYRGIFGTAPFQRLYGAEPRRAADAITSVEYHTLITAPLLVLGTAWPVLLPLGIGSLTLSLAAAVVSAAQSRLPPAQSAIWSRPLLVMLALVQPIVRGWAKYRWQFTTRSIRPTTFRRPDLPRPSFFERPHRDLTFYSEAGVDRLAFLEGILDQFRAESWELRTDQGWSDFDLAVFGRTWSRAWISTVAEELGENRRVLRCRIRTGTSLLGRWTLAGFCAAGLLASTSWAIWQPWILLIWLLVPLQWLLVASERRLVLRLAIGVVDGIAQRQGLSHLLTPSSTPASPRRPLPTRSAGERDDLEELL